MFKPKRVMVVSDDHCIANSAEREIRKGSSRSDVVFHFTLRAAIEDNATGRFDVVIADLGSAELQNVENFRQLKNASAATPVVVLMPCQGAGEKATFSEAADVLPRIGFEPLLLRSIKYATDAFALQRELLKAKQVIAAQEVRLQNHQQASAQFIDNVSHEFRTPLTVISEYASIVRDGIDGPVSSRQVNRLNTLINRADDLSLMVNDLLDTSEIRIGLVNNFATAVPIKDVIGHALRAVERRARSRKISMRCADRDELSVHCDEHKLRRILVNLLNNAIKFSAVGDHVQIDVTRHGSHVHVRLRDNGIGIPEPCLGQIFDRFQQASDECRTSRTKGFGIGLSIANTFTRMNLGRLEVESVEGEGSTFTVILPHADTSSVVECYLNARSEDQIRMIDAIAVHAAEVPGQSIDEDTFDEELELVDELVHSCLGREDVAIRVGKCVWYVLFPSENMSSLQPGSRMLEAWKKQESESAFVTQLALSVADMGTFDIAKNRSKLQAMVEQIPRIDASISAPVLLQQKALSAVSVPTARTH